MAKKLNSYNDSLPISIGEARKLLGKDGSQLSDYQVIDIINDLYLLVQKYFEKSGSIKG